MRSTTSRVKAVDPTASSPSLPPRFIPNALSSCPGNMITTLAVGTCGLYELTHSDMHVEPHSTTTTTTTTSTADEPVIVTWSEVTTTTKKRARALDLIATNTSPWDATIAVSLSASCLATRICGDAIGSVFVPGEIVRDVLPRDATEKLPASLGRTISFVTLSATLPSRTDTTLCRTTADADKASGFVYIIGSGQPPPPPEPWSGLTLRWPLDANIKARCTQGFGGRGHHRGPEYFHSADFDVPSGTLICAVFDGIVREAVDSCFVGGAHVDFLPEANFLILEGQGGGAVVTYLHLAPSSLRVRVGDTVRAGDVLAQTGNTGFSTGAHLHIHVTASMTDDKRTIDWALHDNVRGAVIPLAGHFYGESGWLPPLKELDKLRLDVGCLSDDTSGGAAGGGGGVMVVVMAAAVVVVAEKLSRILLIAFQFLYKMHSYG